MGGGGWSAVGVLSGGSWVYGLVVCKLVLEWVGWRVCAVGSCMGFDRRTCCEVDKSRVRELLSASINRCWSVGVLS